MIQATTQATTKAAIIGVSGYAGGELARLLAFHPHAEIVYAGSSTYAGKPLSAAFAGLHNTPAGRIVCMRPDVARAAELADVVFLAQEAGAAMQSSGVVLRLGKRIIDLSADFRLKDADVYSRYYKTAHTAPDLLREAVYGLPEMHRKQIKTARLVANPGCYTTSAILALRPLVAGGLIETRGIIVDGKSGVSGAGRAKTDLGLRFAEANENVKAYGVGGVHRHVPEIEQEIGAPVTFTPHLVPMTRGMLTTCYGLARSGVNLAAIHAALHEAYGREPFIVLREPGDQPSTKDTLGTNFCHLCAALDERTGTVIVTSAMDNLGKGAAGQAVQNFNIMFGFAETAGLEGAGLWP